MIKAIITDIEGTTTSISFVKDVLFPYARAHLAAFVRSHADDPVVKNLLKDTQAAVGTVLDNEQAIRQLIAWIDADQKITPLKSLQGLIWAEGYQQGAFTGHVYADVPRNLQRWRAEGIALYVYSSGSVAAQQLLFGHTDQGDLTPLFSGYFDTNIGAKQDPVAYARIAETLTLAPAELLFLSDIKAELDAAKAIGFNTLWLCRDAPLASTAAHLQVSNFDDIKW
ncbi:MAG: acireductone synthase [Methylococcaceae bacterium]|nr:acireductone synthase [Methylococcaceae bacterium]